MKPKLKPSSVAILVGLAIAQASARGSNTERDFMLFERLTRTNWCEVHCGHGTCRHVQLLRSGSMRRWATSDYLEFDQKGIWNFTSDSDSSGRLWLQGVIQDPVRGPYFGSDSSRSLLRFQLRGDTLAVAGERYQRCGSPAVISGGSARGPEDLPHIAEPAVLRTLTAHDWVRIDDFDPYRIPRAWHFDSSLTYSTQYEDGRGNQSGAFSVDGDRLVVDDRRMGAGVWKDTLSLDAHLYVDARGPHHVRMAGFPSQAAGIRLVISYDGELRAGVPTRLNLRYGCASYYRDEAPYRLRAFRATMQKYRPVAGGLGYDGPPARVAERTYGDRSLALGQSFSDTVTIVPPGRGDDVELHLEWDYVDGHGLLPGSAREQLRVR